MANSTSGPPQRRPDESPQRDESTPEVIASGERSAAAGRDFNAPVFLGDIVNSVVKISTALPLWQRAVLLAVLLVGSLTLGGVVLLLLEDQDGPATLPPPDPARFEIVGSPTLTITALAINEAALWLGAQDGAQHALYRLDAAQQTNAEPQHMLDVDAEIIALMVDCKENVWLALKNVGVRVYRPLTGQYDTLLNPTTTDGWLTKKTVYDVAARCVDDEVVEVWLGREGVYTLRYDGAYPSLEPTRTIAFVQPDKVFEEYNQELPDVRALHYADDSNTLWVAGLEGQLLSISLKGVLEPQSVDKQDDLWSLSQSPDGRVWAGGCRHLWLGGYPAQSVPLVSNAGVDLDTRALVIAAGQRWVWFGDECPPDSDCRPLGVCDYHNSCDSVDLGTRKQVRDIAIDHSGAVWIGTEKGLIFYPAPEN
jgi:ligand-binding sensor domain-containing protein